MNAPLRAVVFDLDGTLIDSMPMVLDAYAHALSPYYPGMTGSELMSRLGGPPDRMFAAMLSAEQAQAALQRLHEYSGANWKLMQPFVGMHAILDDLRTVHSVALWTGRDRSSTEWLLQEHGIGGKLRACVCGDDLGSHKPDPAGLMEVIRQLGAAKDETIFVGDADVDVVAGAAVGIRTLLITHGRSVPAQVLQLAWKSVGTPDEAYALLRRESGTSGQIVSG